MSTVEENNDTEIKTNNVPAEYAPPTPPPPASEINKDNIEQLLNNQFNQSYKYHTETMKIKSEYDKYKAEVEATIHNNNDKINNYDNLSKKAEQLNGYVSEILKEKYGKLDKDFLELYADELKLDELIKDPLNGINVIEKNLKIYNNMLSKIKQQQPDGTRGKPASSAAVDAKLETRQDYIQAAREYNRSRLGM